MDNENQRKKEKLPVDRWVCDYECDKCRHFCGTVSNIVRNAMTKCKTCGTSSEPTKEVSKIYSIFSFVNRFTTHFFKKKILISFQVHLKMGDFYNPSKK